MRSAMMRSFRQIEQAAWTSLAACLTAPGCPSWRSNRPKKGQPQCASYSGDGVDGPSQPRNSNRIYCPSPPNDSGRSARSFRLRAARYGGHIRRSPEVWDEGGSYQRTPALALHTPLELDEAFRIDHAHAARGEVIVHAAVSIAAAACVHPIEPRTAYLAHCFRP
jgi:hypothetical protein